MLATEGVSTILLSDSEAAPNYRKVRYGGFPLTSDSLESYIVLVHGVDSISETEIRKVLRHIGDSKVLWICLMDEPVIYINGRPFALRDAQKPFTKLDYKGFNRNRASLEQMEARLKEDILMESSRCGNKILVTDEPPDGQMLDQWEPTSPDSLKTLLEII